MNVLNYRRQLLNGTGLESPKVLESPEVIHSPSEITSLKVNPEGFTKPEIVKRENKGLTKLSNTLEKIHINSFEKNKKKKYITF
jgi:hypothetical protein